MAEDLLIASADGLPALTDHDFTYRPRLQHFSTESLTHLASLEDGYTYTRVPSISAGPVLTKQYMCIASVTCNHALTLLGNRQSEQGHVPSIIRPDSMVSSAMTLGKRTYSTD